MAQKHQTTDEQIAALTTSLNAILKVHESSSSHNQLNASTSEIALPGSVTTSLIGSAQLSLLQFTLAVRIPATQQQRFDYCKPHVILHVDGISASATPSACSEGASYSRTPLETVQLALVCDKFPLDTISSEVISQGAMFLIKFWADLNYEQVSSELPALFQVTTMFESSTMMQITCKTSVCSFGRSIGDKAEKLTGIQVTPNRVLYQSVRAPLCDYLVNFIHKLKGCGHVATMNGVLENFSVLQSILDDATQKTLLCFAYVFEVCPPELSATTGAMCKVYRLDDSGTTTENTTS